MQTTIPGTISTVMTMIMETDTAILMASLIPRFATSERGLWAIKWSFIGLAATAVFQLAVVFISGSVALLAFGQEINSAALIADGYHARVDGWTSLAVLFGAV